MTILTAWTSSPPGLCLLKHDLSRSDLNLNQSWNHQTCKLFEQNEMNLLRLLQITTSPMRTDSVRKSCCSRSKSWWRRETFWWMTWSSRGWGQCRSTRASGIETSTPISWSPASMRDCQTQKFVFVPLVGVLSSVKTVQSNYHPLDANNPPLPQHGHHTHTHTPTVPQCLSFWEMRGWITGKKDRNEKRERDRCCFQIWGGHIAICQDLTTLNRACE